MGKQTPDFWGDCATACSGIEKSTYYPDSEVLWLEHKQRSRGKHFGSARVQKTVPCSSHVLKHGDFRCDLFRWRATSLSTRKRISKLVAFNPAMRHFSLPKSRLAPCSQQLRNRGGAVSQWWVHSLKESVFGLVKSSNLDSSRNQSIPSGA